MTMDDVLDECERCDGKVVVFEKPRLVVITPHWLKAADHDVRRISFGCFDKGEVEKIRHFSPVVE